MTSIFEKAFKGKSIYAQLAETIKGGWRTHMSEDDRHYYKVASIAKGAAFVGTLAFAGLTMLAAAGIAGGFAGLAIGTAAFYCCYAFNQARIRADVETEMKNPSHDTKFSTVLKHTAKYLVLPLNRP